ncbi:MAG: hypothetical protein ACOCW2_03095 [Chitinivibrionales bacterium]
MISHQKSQKHDHAIDHGEASQRRIVDCVGQPAFVCDKDDRVLETNTEGCSFAGIRGHELGTFSLSHLFIFKKQAVWSQKCLDKGIHIQQETIKTRDGQWWETEIIANVLNRGEDKRVLIILSNLRQRMGEEDRGELEECFSRLSELAHDCNNMLGAVAGYADMIKLSNRHDTGIPRDVQLEKRISIILQASMRAADQVDNIRKTIKRCVGRFYKM